MGIENQKSSRQFQVDDIRSLEREPALEAWKWFEIGGDDVKVAEELGYPIKYFRKLFAQEFIHRLDSGAHFTEFPKFPKSLEDFCWNTLCREIEPNLHEKISTPSCIQLRQKLSLLYQENSGVTKISKKSSRALLKELSERFNLDNDQIKSLIMIAMAEEGLVLEQIAGQFKLSRERVRQIISLFGVSPIAFRRKAKELFDSEKKEKQDELSNLIESWISTHPGCYISEIAEKFSVSETYIRVIKPKNFKKLVISGATKIDSVKMRKFSREQILEALKVAYEFKNPSMSMYSVNETQPLTGPFYEKLRRNGSVFGPSKARILQVFGTWKAACEEAGVPSVDAVRDTYELRWTDEQLVGQLAEFFSTTESHTLDGFDKWCRLDDSRASSGTIINQIGPWAESCESALLHLRRNWTAD